jgi:hypothetical protein
VKILNGIRIEPPPMRLDGDRDRARMGCKEEGRQVEAPGFQFEMRAHGPPVAQVGCRLGELRPSAERERARGEPRSLEKGSPRVRGHASNAISPGT